MIASLLPAALVPVVFVVWFLVKTWVKLLWTARSGVLAVADLRYSAGAWARRRGWTVSDEGAYLLTELAGAEHVVASAQGEVAGCPCTVLYCWDESPYVACFLRLPRRFPGPLGSVLTRRRRWVPRLTANPAPAYRDVAFDRRFRVRCTEPDRLALLTSPVRAGLLRMVAVAPLRRLRVAGDLVVVDVDGWVLGEELDAVVDVMRAVAPPPKAAPSA